MAADETLETTGAFEPPKSRVMQRGAVIIMDAEGPCCRPIPIEGPLVIGRDDDAGIVLHDHRVSRRHTRLSYDEDGPRVEDLGSRNGTWVDGIRCEPGEIRHGARCLRVGRAVLIFSDDIGSFVTGMLVDGSLVLGPRCRRAYADIARAAETGANVLVVGETGVGKERAARHFHARSGRANGPFVAINCAAIPSTVAERLLFGSCRGAFSGATDAAGYIEAASGGTLFLDEVGELDLEIQSKLLRVLETKEVMRLGTTRPRPVDIRVCAATHRDLESLAATGKFRRDLYYRICRPSIELPPLRDRPAEVPWLVNATLTELEAGLVATADFIEQTLLRPWPGNVRELLVETRFAGSRAKAEDRNVVRASDLRDTAGLELEAREDADHRRAPIGKDRLDDEARVEAALAECKGNVSAAARALGVHRNQLRRWLARRPG